MNTSASPITWMFTRATSHISIPNHDSNPVTGLSPQLEDFRVNPWNPWGWKIMIQHDPAVQPCIPGVSPLALHWRRYIWAATQGHLGRQWRPKLRVKGTRGIERCDVEKQQKSTHHNPMEYPWISQASPLSQSEPIINWASAGKDGTDLLLTELQLFGAYLQAADLVNPERGTSHRGHRETTVFDDFSGPTFKSI